MTAALKRGWPSSILNGMRYGPLRGFIPHYVWAEVRRVLVGSAHEKEVLAQILGSRRGVLPRCSIAGRQVRVRPRTPCRQTIGIDAPSGACRRLL
jgi:hypothetical protein